MKSIWKYPLEVTDEQTISAPSGAKLLHVALQGGDLCVWAEVSPAAIKAPLPIRIYGTGHDLPDDPGKHLGTFMLEGGTLVFHAYAPAI